MNKESRYPLIDTVSTYFIDGKHEVLGVFRDETQDGTYHEYVVVWRHMDTGAVNTLRTNSYGMVFGQGPLLKKSKTLQRVRVGP